VGTIASLNETMNLRGNDAVLFTGGASFIVPFDSFFA
jgi:hypothetical protein